MTMKESGDLNVKSRSNILTEGVVRALPVGRRLSRRHLELCEVPTGPLMARVQFELLLRVVLDAVDGPDQSRQHPLLN